MSEQARSQRSATMDALVEVAEHASGLGVQSLEIMRREGFVLDNLDDPWQKLAFTLHGMLVDVSAAADLALEQVAHA